MPDIKPFIRKANYYETDQMGIIHHANYIHWMEEARVDFMEQMGFGYDKSVNSGIDIAVLEVKCRYKSMVKFADTLAIEVWISELTPVKMVVDYKISDAVSGELRTEAQTTHCFLDGETHRIQRLNKRLPELYELFSACVIKREK